MREMRKYALIFKRWLSSHRTHKQWWLDNSKFIRSKLAKARIASIDINDVENIVRCLNCMNAVPLNKTMFLNPRNNNLTSITNAWNILLHGEGPLEVRMSECHRALKRFGRSSIQELVGFFYPNQYPLRNRNSNAGLRFFGYKIAAY